jgi:hypothetical protein
MPPKTEEAKELLRDVLCLWVAARSSSITTWLCGDDLLDIQPVVDDTSPYNGHCPIPPVMSAQLQIIAISKILRPLKKRIVGHLAAMSSASQTRKNWFAIYLAYFTLLHSCALVTRRDEEYAAQIGLPVSLIKPSIDSNSLEKIQLSETIAKVL